MLKILDLSKEVDMTAVRGGTSERWEGCGYQDYDGRCHDRDGDRDGRDRDRCDPDERRFDRAAPLASFNLGVNGSAY